MTRASLIVRCYNEERHLGKLLSSLEEQSVKPHQVVVVDSGSTDATLQIAVRHGAHVEHIDPRDFSFGRSLNLGCAAATGDILVMASAHTYPADPHWLERLLAPFGQDPDAALVYGRQVGNGLTKLSEQRIFLRQFPPGREFVLQDHPYCNNANAAVRRSVWRDMPYDETLTGLEDIDWASRALERGHTLYYAGDAPVVHVHEESPRQIMNRYRRESLAWQRMYPGDGRGTLGCAWALLRDLSGDLAAALGKRRFLHQAGSCLVFRTMQHLGAWLGRRDLGRLPEELRQAFYYPSAERLKEPSYRPPSPAKKGNVTR